MSIVTIGFFEGTTLIVSNMVYYFCKLRKVVTYAEKTNDQGTLFEVIFKAAVEVKNAPQILEHSIIIMLCYRVKLQVDIILFVNLAVTFPYLIPTPLGG